MISVTFPDGAQRQFAPGTTGFDIAKSISPSLAKRTVAMALDGIVVDLADPISSDAKIEFINREDPRALELIRHDCAHVLAEAVEVPGPGAAGIDEPSAFLGPLQAATVENLATLSPGDAVWLGTDELPQSLAPGDVIEIEITGIAG